MNDSIGTNNPLTNVARSSRMVEERAEDGTLQIVYYHTGVGAGASRISNSIDGTMGRGKLRSWGRGQHSPVPVPQAGTRKT
jgi:hypothetical protein